LPSRLAVSNVRHKRLRRYCSQTCRQRAYEKRRDAAAIEAAVAEALRKLGVKK
jgi:hypothetical protein